MKIAGSLLLLLVAAGCALAACPADCPQRPGGYSSPHWSCCDLGSLDAPLCAGEDRCNDDTQSSCCGVQRSGDCYRVVRCFGSDQCVVDSCGDTDSNARCYAAANTAVCESTANGCTTRQLYDSRYTMCCGGTLYDNVNWGCCNGVAYEVARSDCCDGAVVPDGQCTPPSPSASRAPAPSASSSRPPAPSPSSAPPPDCAAACARSKGWSPAGGWSCCDFGPGYPLCAGEDLCYDPSQSTCCDASISGNGNCYRVVRCWGGDACASDECSDTATCYDPTTTAVCQRDEGNCTLTQLYSPPYTECCGGGLYDTATWGCCSGTPYQLSTHKCCNGATVVPRGTAC
jgi:hypothetical protein